MFEGFVLDEIAVGPVTLRVRRGGRGPAVVLLHGHPRTQTTWYTVVGHDRGALVAFRTAMDHADRGHPSGGHGRPSRHRASGAHRRHLRRRLVALVVPRPDDQPGRPAVVRGMAEDYRAGLGIDRAHDAADRAAGRRVSCPTLLLESRDDDLDIHGDPAAIWQSWLEHPLRHVTIGSGHHQAEQAPDEVGSAIIDFLRG